LYIYVRKQTNNQTDKDMTLSEIKQDAKNYKGQEMTAATFGWAFKMGMKELNTLVKDGVFEVTNKTVDGNKVYRVK
jgi:hypothetical protein